MKRLFVLVLLVSFLFGGFEQRSKIDLSTDQLIEVQITVFETSSSERALWKSNERVEIVDGQITDIDAIVPDAFKDRPELWLTVEYDGRMLTDERVMLTSSALRRESPTEPSETSEEMATHLKIGRPGETDDLVVYSPQVGFGVDTPSERIDVEGAIAIREGSSPTSTTDVGKVYVNDADGHLYFIDEAGNITDLTVDANALQSVSSSAYTTGRTDHMRIIPGRGTDVTESATNDTIYISYNVDVTSGGLPPCSSAPSMPDAMEGASIVCTGEPGAAYAVPPVESATFYRWTIPGDAVITSGIGTNAVNIVFGSTDGTVCARAVNSCGTSSDRCMSVSINRPTSPGSITGTSPVCAGQTGVSYYIASVPGATNYIWTLPPGAVLASGTGTPNITVNFGTSGGDICVQTENSCGTSTPQCMSIVMTDTPATPGVITGDNDLCGGDTDITYSITPVAEATSYSWTVPSGASITAGSGTASITVDFGTTSGSVCVTASSICGTSSSSCKSITVTNPPSAPGSISGLTVVSPGTADETYSISPVTGATSYLWTVTGDATIDGSATGTSVNIDFGSYSGTTVDLCVTASNTCGTSSPSCETITIAVPSGSLTFNYTGSQQTWTVPGGVTSIGIECWGAEGGTGDVAGGRGGYAEGDLSVTPGSTIYIYVGGQSGWNGGGTGGNAAGAGGGASDVRVSGTAYSNRVIVAGGGGGGGHTGNSWTAEEGGYGGGLTGGRGYSSSGYSGSPGTAGGYGGTQSAGGAGSSGCGCSPGGNGSFGTGGIGTSCSSWGGTSGGGGGGGGYYGGGGGGNCGGGDGGGGGSSYIGGVSGGSTSSNVRSGNGQVIISW